MRFSDIDPYLLIEHTHVDELLALLKARDDVRAMAAEPAPPSSFYDTEPIPKSSTVPAGPKRAA